MVGYMVACTWSCGMCTMYDCPKKIALPSLILEASLATAFLLARPQDARAYHPYHQSPAALRGNRVAAL